MSMLLGLMPRRAAARALSAVVALLGLALLGLGFAPGAAAAIVDCPPMSSNVCKDLRPVAECFWPNNDGTVSVVWGWDNPRSDTARIEPGSHNFMTPGANDQGQPSLFGPGRNRNAFFTVTGVSAGAVSWRLGNELATVSLVNPAGDVARCATKPVPQVGDVGAVLLGVLVLVLSALTVVAARPRRSVLVAR